MCADLRSFAMRVTPICRYVRCRRLGDAGFIVRRHLSIWRAPRRNDTCRLYVNGRRAILNNRQDCTRLQSTIRDWGGLMHLSDGHDLGEVAFAVASYLENADGVLAKVLGRLGHDSARDIVEKSRQALRDLGQELEFLSLMTEPGELRGSWVLNPRWHTVAFDVASSNDTVLLTVAINAVRVIQQIWDRLLDDRWPPDVRDLLKSQRKRICEVEESLLEARSRVGRSRTSVRDG